MNSETQSDLFGLSIREQEQRRSDYPDGFWPWLEANEHLYQSFVRIALHAKAKGFPRWGGKAITEHLRWETAMRDGYQNAVKINNNAHPGLVRLAMAEHLELDGFFEIRQPPARDSAIRLDGSTYA